MKCISIILLALLLSSTAKAQDFTTFIFTRHAEKAKEGGKDPVLSPAGENRAVSLAETLQHTPVDLIISTPFKRTLQTVEHVASQKQLTTSIYDYRDPNLLKNLFEEYAGKTILVSGHSNTTPMLVNQLLGEEQYQPLDESDYGKLFIVTCSQQGSCSAVVLAYGDAVE